MKGCNQYRSVAVDVGGGDYGGNDVDYDDTSVTSDDNIHDEDSDIL